MLTEKSKKLYLKNIKSSISNIAKYIPGESDNKKNIKLSSNESPFLIPKKIRDIASKNVQTSNQYPDGDSLILKKSISKKFRINPNQIICGNGSDDILFLIGLAFTQENCEVICSQYSFLYYPIIAHSVGARVVFAKTKKLNVAIIISVLVPFFSKMYAKNSNPEIEKISKIDFGLYFFLINLASSA